MTLTPFDDYPIHQTAQPVAHPADGDPNRYDRYYFNCYDRSGEWYAAIGMGLYPNRGVIDAAFSIARGDLQRSVFGSGRAPADRARTAVGPVTLDVVEPLRTNRIRVDGDGLRADLRFSARTRALEEPRQTIHDGARVIMDVTRLVQWGTWDGWIEVDGERIAVHGLGTKDRSWGVRPVGEPVPGAPRQTIAGGGVFLVWAPVNFDDGCTHVALFEHPDGSRWFESAVAVPLLEPGAEPFGGEDALRHATAIYEIDFEPGTRRARAATITMNHRDGARASLRFEPLQRFQMKGIGYWHPDWAHGHWRGEHVAGSDTWKLSECDPLAFENLHVQQLCRVRSEHREGIGVLEQLILGPHAPTGFAEFTDGAR